MQAQQALLRPIPGGLNVPQPPTTEVVQQYLEDNEVLITTILECINTGRVEDAVQYQQRLQQNLMWLAGIADTQPQPGAPPAVIPAPTVPPPPGQMQLYATGGQVVLAAQAVAAAAVQAQQSTAQQPGAAPAITQPPS